MAVTRGCFCVSTAEGVSASTWRPIYPAISGCSGVSDFRGISLFRTPLYRATYCTQKEEYGQDSSIVCMICIKGVPGTFSITTKVDKLSNHVCFR